MNSTSVSLVALLGVLCALPWVVKWIQRRTGRGLGAQEDGIKLLSVLPLGPQQRVITVEVGAADARVQLVLGVTAQSVNCLHVLSTRQGEGDKDGESTALQPTPMDAQSSLMFAHKL